MIFVAESTKSDSSIWPFKQDNQIEGVVGLAAHIHRYWELVHQEKHDKGTAAVIVGMSHSYKDQK